MRTYKKCTIKKDYATTITKELENNIENLANQTGLKSHEIKNLAISIAEKIDADKNMKDFFLNTDSDYQLEIIEAYADAVEKANEAIRLIIHTTPGAKEVFIQKMALLDD
jgi:hypothetical protein